MFKYSIIMFHYKACQEKAERKAILNFAFGLLTLLWTWRPPYDKRIFACPIASFTTRSSEFQTENAQIRNSHHFSTHQLRFFQIQGLLCYYSVAFSWTCKLLFSCADTLGVMRKVDWFCCWKLITWTLVFKWSNILPYLLYVYNHIKSQTCLKSGVMHFVIHSFPST